jgi:hypothetical protein
MNPICLKVQEGGRFSADFRFSSGNKRLDVFRDPWDRAGEICRWHYVALVPDELIDSVEFGLNGAARQTTVVTASA